MAKIVDSFFLWREPPANRHYVHTSPPPLYTHMYHTCRYIHNATHVLHCMNCIMHKTSLTQRTSGLVVGGACAAHSEFAGACHYASTSEHLHLSRPKLCSTRAKCFGMPWWMVQCEVIELDIGRASCVAIAVDITLISEFPKFSRRKRKWHTVTFPPSLPL